MGINATGRQHSVSAAADHVRIAEHSGNAHGAAGDAYWKAAFHSGEKHIDYNGASRGVNSSNDLNSGKFAMYGLTEGYGAARFDLAQGRQIENSSHVHPQYNSVTQLRKLIDLPVFNGNAKDWPVFFTMFSESSAAYRYSNLENLLRLQKSLIGAARDEVEALLINPVNVRHIIRMAAISIWTTRTAYKIPIGYCQ